MRSPARGGELDRLVGIEAPRSRTRDHQIAIALSGEPGEILLGGNAAIHDHQGSRWRLQALEHGGEGAASTALPAKTRERRTKPL